MMRMHNNDERRRLRKLTQAVESADMEFPVDIFSDGQSVVAFEYGIHNEAIRVYTGPAGTLETETIAGDDTLRAEWFTRDQQFRGHMREVY